MTKPTSPLSDFIRRTLDHHRMSYRQLAEAAVDPETGERLDHRWLNGLVKGRYTTAPAPARLRALAAGLRVPPVVVKRLAAQQFLDLETDGGEDVGDDAYLIYLQAKRLLPEDRAVVRDLVRRLADCAAPAPPARR
ncbi:hypothetical protein O4J56_30975 [Nocardiopsis sp. RSe5-2]|uniref:XRE family transcriptional regulator n=1 Tax=Nocardiopsis endophytica TaxID=3018445 RepID=A0ABT4UED5_9ACTN|nr:hypothetical protein [Nocardiopsis endophytica]MDA2815106.1 hypothetical protein [Nocardiopsis endophytica]